MFSADNNGFRPEFDDSHWVLTDPCFEKARNRTWETLFSLGNGYLGMRGSFEEGLDQFSIEGTFINGFYDSFPLHYPEKFLGYAESDQIILNVANARVIRLVFEDGERYDPLAARSRILDYRRRLDMRTGLLIRESDLGIAQRQAVSGCNRSGWYRSAARMSPPSA